MSKYIPFLGYRDISDADATEMDLDTQYNWKGFCFEWLDSGFMFWVKAIGLKETNNN